MKSGIYKISAPCGKFYIGSSLNMNHRKTIHFKKLKDNSHHNQRLQNYVNAHGIECLVFSIVEYCDRSILLQKEQEYIDQLNPFFNICRFANSRLGLPSPNKGKKFSEEHKQKIGISNLGKVISKEQRELLSASMKGKPGYWKGKNLSQETKNKLSDFKKRNPNPIPTACSFKGRKHSEETKLKMRAAILRRKAA